MLTSAAQPTKEWYEKYYREKGGDRNDLLRNPEVLFQHFAFYESLIRAIRGIDHIDLVTARVLDVGCGSGASLANFLQLGFLPENLYGIDILEERVRNCRERYPNFVLSCDDATRMSFPSESFDIVTESTMFVQITDEGLAASIAGEMIRTCKRGGHLVLIDWRYGKPGNTAYRALSASRIRALFRVGTDTRLVCARKGALVPPLGRFLSRRLPALYFPVRALVPLLAGSMTTVLKRVA